MSIRLNAANEGLLRIANLPTTMGPFTIMAWYYRSVNQPGNTDECLFSFGEDTGNQIYEGYLRNNNLALWNGSVLTNGGTNFTVGVWRHVCLRRDSLSLLSMILNGAEYISVNPPNILTERLLLGNNAQFSEFWNGRIAAFKAWNAYLTLPQILSEMPYWGAVNRSNINAWCPLRTFDDLSDYSGNGNHFTSLGGTLTTEEDPPLSEIGNPFMMHVSAKRI